MEEIRQLVPDALYCVWVYDIPSREHVIKEGFSNFRDRVRGHKIHMKTE